MTTPKRSSNFSPSEERLLMNLVTRYRHILENKKTDAITNSAKQNTWIVLANQFNRETGEIPRDVRILKNKYENIKKRRKQKLAENKFNQKNISSESIKTIIINDADMQIQDITGEQMSSIVPEADDAEKSPSPVQIIKQETVELHDIPTISSISENIETASIGNCTKCLYNVSISDPLRIGKGPRRKFISNATKWSVAKTNLLKLQNSLLRVESQKKIKMMEEKHALEMVYLREMNELKMQFFIEKEKLRIELLKQELKQKEEIHKLKLLNK